MERGDDGRFRAESVKWLDIAQLPCRLKYEYNSSNRKLYGDEPNMIFFEQDSGLKL